MKIKAIILLVLLSGCATANFNSKKPITDSGMFYQQDGENINVNDLIKNLKDNPKSKDDAQSAETLRTVAMGTSVGSGILLGLGIAMPSPKAATATSAGQGGISDSDRATLLISGGVLLAGTFILDLIASKHLSNAVSSHNSSLKDATTKISISPFASYASTGGVCGFKLEF